MKGIKVRTVVFEGGEYNSGKNHPEYEIRDTRPSDFLRKYGQGKLEDLPKTSAPEIVDNRTVDQMLDEPVEHMSTESIDVLMEIEANRDKFDQALKTIELTESARKRYDDALSVINNPNSSPSAKTEAYNLHQLTHKECYTLRS